MLSSKSLVGLVIIVIVTVLLVHLKTSSKGPDDNRFILKAPDDYDTFVESIEEYRYYECLDNFANEIPDQIVKETIIKHKDSILSIIYINIYTYARNRKYSLEPVEVSHAESIKHYFESFFSEPNPSIDRLLFRNG
ncbi:uncharacterized protein VICG_00323 [Vittaforma corneae ATCC 50505]|uniref:Uncharacterized protein n=1 Tax=Vittaforma corneae (strain ATCC 50505) TaxID=993615 RepID=L2GP07_VITCO|nr:uncharacterized protein VICG_00323 [Vittaforma corneae ATCC 50505]ELA42571.1 hypothetical protein VICG_00323 [Vittaforma corneae ATCC 50505]